MSELRDLVGAWQKQLARCNHEFETACAAIGRELDAVGGFATTSPDADECCTTYSWKKDTAGWMVGAARVGEDRSGHSIPHHPDVGDRCHAINQAWRKEAMAVGEAQRAVRECVRKIAGTEVDPTSLYETVALALVKSEQGEREAFVRWLRSGYPGAARAWESVDLIDSIIDAVERGEHLR